MLELLQSEAYFVKRWWTSRTIIADIRAAPPNALVTKKTSLNPKTYESFTAVVAALIIRRDIPGIAVSDC